MKSAATLLLLALAFTTVNSQYSCPSTCLPPTCICGSKSIPGGLTPDQTPQFITLTWDDSVQTRQFAIFDKLFPLQNPNGCPVPSTFFVSFDYNEMDTTQRLYNQYRWEIATHTLSHYGTFFVDLVSYPIIKTRCFCLLLRWRMKSKGKGTP